MRADVVVVGAGIVGVSVALHLQKRGRAVVLVDRRQPGEETSFGNAGIVQHEAVLPHAFPQSLGTLWRYALNRSPEARYHLSALPAVAPFLARYWWHSRPARHRIIAERYASLIRHCVAEHLSLATEAGCARLFHRQGWIKVFRSQASMDRALREAEEARRGFGVESVVLTGEELLRKEPFLRERLAGGLHWTSPITVPNPHELTLQYAALFKRLGGRLAPGNAATLGESGCDWRIETTQGTVAAPQVVVALGPWADIVTAKLGYRLPLAVKRGYHMHYGIEGNAVLNHPIVDADMGYCLAPMASGIRLTTGAEFALRDAPKTPVQLDIVEPAARRMFPLRERLDRDPWMGARPCTPDMLPIIGPAPRHRNLWFAIGHGHQGLTLGPVTGRLVAELVVGDQPFVDPAPYRVERF
jgi:D-amino-acid dehydrogenase